MKTQFRIWVFANSEFANSEFQFANSEFANSEFANSEFAKQKKKPEVGKFEVAPNKNAPPRADGLSVIQRGAGYAYVRANLLYSVDNDLHMSMTQRCRNAGVSRSSAYRWLQQREQEGRKSALLSGGSEQTVTSEENLWVLCHAIRQSQSSIHTIHDVVRVMHEASAGNIVWTYEQARRACHLVDFSCKKFAKVAAQRETPVNLAKHAAYLEWIDGIGTTRLVVTVVP